MLKNMKEVQHYRNTTLPSRKNSVSNAEFMVLNKLAQELPEGASILEVGSFTFGSTIAFIEVMRRRPDLTLTTVDVVYRAIEFYDDMDASIKDRWTLLTGPSWQVLGEMEEKKFDLIFIDGDHSYEGACGDIENAKRLVKNGGRVAVHDSEWRYVWRAFIRYFDYDFAGISHNPWEVPFRPGTAGTVTEGKKRRQGIVIAPSPPWMTVNFWISVKEGPW